jgi:hypothetical protein
VHPVWVGDWQLGIGAERNMVVLSMPSRLDPSLAPAGHQVLHGCTPANEPWEIWKDLERGTPAYEALKLERCGVFHQVVAQLLPDWRERVVLELQGTPWATATGCGCIRAAMARPGRRIAGPSPAVPPRSRVWFCVARGSFPASACRRWRSAGPRRPIGSSPPGPSGGSSGIWS